ncbi:MAG: DUF1244 domain-containing protein, partial [Rhodospirillales bacterium]|nr:DUF1244 domain-containing protein [Rhodospirillales bacterium]
YREEAGARGVEITDPAAREIVYGMPYDEWKAKHQAEAGADKKAAFEKSFARTVADEAKHKGG